VATYKVIQDIEADDKLIGPLSMKQFVFACVAAGFGFVAFIVASKVIIYAAIPFLLPVLVFGVLAAPLGGDQSTEIWLAAKIRFLIKPRKRIWDQSGIKQLVTITAPKKIEQILTKNFSQQEVKSRLRALAETIDTRGWATKNVNLNLYGTPAYSVANSDRLIDMASLPQAVSDANVSAADDIMDYQNNPVAQHFNQIVNEASQAQRNQAFTLVSQASSHATKPQVISDSAQLASPINYQISQADTDALLTHANQEKKQEELEKPHHKQIKTPQQIADDKSKNNNAQANAPLKNPAIIELAKTDDLSVESIAHLASRKPKPNDEVVIRLR